jgi:hypothetical protein
MIRRSFVALALACGLCVASTQATLLQETFDTAGSSGNFLVTQVAGSVDVITFGADYGALGIAEAPSTPMGSAAQRGLFIQANKPAGTTGAINGINVTASSGGVAINFTQDIRMTFDMWLSYDTAPGATNTTEQAVFGINTDGAGVNSRTGATQTGADGVWYHISGDGGYGATSTTANSRDNVNYINNTVPTGGRLDNNDPPFPTLFPSPPAPLLGVPAKSWVQVAVEEIGGNVRMTMNGTTVFDVPNSGPTSGSIFLGYQDPFSGSIGSATETYVVFDNLVVVPEPTTCVLLGCVLALGWIRQK